MMRALWIAVCCLCVVSIPLLCALFWKRRHGHMRPVWMGALGFFTFAAIAEMLFVLLCLSALGRVSEALNASPVRLVVFSCLCAGVFEETGRFVVYRSGLAHCRGRSVATGYAIGHFGAEILILTVSPLLFHAPEHFGALQAGMTVLERAAACAGHAALSVLVWAAFCERKSALLLAAIVLHAICDAPVGMLRYGMMGQGASALLFAACITLLCLFSLRYWRKLPAGAMIEAEDRESDVERGKTDE